MDSDLEQKLSNRKVPQKMEDDGSSVHDSAGDEDEEFMSCDEGEENSPDVLEEYQQTPPDTETSRNPDCVLRLDTDQCKMKSSGSVSDGRSSSEFAWMKAPFSRNVGIGKCSSKKLDVVKELVSAVNKALGSSSDGNAYGPAEGSIGEEDRSDESEDEFYDSRSTVSSRIQSVDEGYAEVLSRAHERCENSANTEQDFSRCDFASSFLPLKISGVIEEGDRRNTEQETRQSTVSLECIPTSCIADHSLASHTAPSSFEWQAEPSADPETHSGNSCTHLTYSVSIAGSLDHDLESKPILKEQTADVSASSGVLPVNSKDMIAALSANVNLDTVSLESHESPHKEETEEDAVMPTSLESVNSGESSHKDKQLSHLINEKDREATICEVNMNSEGVVYEGSELSYTENREKDTVMPPSSVSVNSETENLGQPVISESQPGILTTDQQISEILSQTYSSGNIQVMPPEIPSTEQSFTCTEFSTDGDKMPSDIDLLVNKEELPVENCKTSSIASDPPSEIIAVFDCTEESRADNTSVQACVAKNGLDEGTELLDATLGANSLNMADPALSSDGGHESLNNMSSPSPASALSLLDLSPKIAQECPQLGSLTDEEHSCPPANSETVSLSVRSLSEVSAASSAAGLGIDPSEDTIKVPRDAAAVDTSKSQSSEVVSAVASTQEVMPIRNLPSGKADENVSPGLFRTFPHGKPSQTFTPDQGTIQPGLICGYSSALTQSTETGFNNVIGHPASVTNNENISTREELVIETYNDNYDLAVEDEDRVSEDSLGETVLACVSGGEVHDDGSSSDSDPSDSLDESEEESSEGFYKDGPRNVEDMAKYVDVHQAKLRASLSWLLSKVYGSTVPKELQDPFYENAEGQLVLRPVMVNLLSSSELYCQACSNMFPETHTQWKGHWSIIQVLSRKGIYILDIQDSAVTETVLVQTAPFRLKAHLSLIDALMKAYTCEVASVEKVVKAVRRMTTFPASSELPATSEEALMFWVNKICSMWGMEGANKGKLEEVTEGMVGQKVRSFNKTPYSQEPVLVPPLEDLMQDIGDGCSIAAVIAYYRPHLLNIRDLCLKEDIGIADSLYNLKQIGRFCRNYLPWKRFHLSYEDLLYAPEVLKINIIAFLADLFLYFEGPDSQAESSGLNSTKSSSDKVDAAHLAGKKSWQNSPSNIAPAGKKTFHRQIFEETSGIGQSLGSGPNFHQSSLSKRISGRHCVPQEEGGCSAAVPNRQRGSRRAMSLSTTQDREIIQKSVLAWQDDQKLPHRSGEHDGSNNRRSELPSNSGFDVGLNKNRNASSSLSLDLSGLNTSGSVYDHSHPFSTTPTTDQILEPLLPAVLRPAKEKGSNLSKAEERGDSVNHMSPDMKNLVSLQLQRHQNTGYLIRPSSVAGNRELLHYTRLARRKKPQSPPEAQSPSASQPQRSIQQQQLSVLGESQSTMSRLQPKSPRTRPYKTFVIGPDSNADFMMEMASNQTNSGNISPSVSGRAMSTAGSYTVEDRASTAQAARAAGIPVVVDSQDLTLNTDRSREGSVASSGEYSDHESRKIQQEYKMRESGITNTSDTKVDDTSFSSMKPFLLISDHLSKVLSPGGSDDDAGLLIKSPPTITNFAELKRFKDKLGYDFDKVDKSALIYMQSGSHGGPYDKMSGFDLKATFNAKQSQGHNQEKSNSENQQPEVVSPVPDNATAEEAEQSSAELFQLRLKLEQKRKDIQRKKHRQEAQQNKMRQQLGKAAFMRVVSKHLDGEDDDDDESSDVEGASSEQPPNTALASQKLSLSGTPRNQSPAHPQSTAQGAQNSVIPTAAPPPAQRYTDWRAQKQLSKGGGGSVSGLNLPAEQSQQLLPPRAGAVGGGDAGLNYSSPVGNKAFSREGIQQTIDNVRHKWFSNGSDLITGGIESGEGDDVDRGSFRLHHGDLTAWGNDRSVRERSQTPVRSHSLSPLHSASQAASSKYITSPMTNSVPDLEYQEYDSSLDKLNSSLTELQGEIMRLSLQHEQLKAAQSPISAATIGSPQTRPIHGIPKQGPYMQGKVARQGDLQSPQQPKTIISVPYQNYNAVTFDPGLSAHADTPQTTSSNSSLNNPDIENGFTAGQTTKATAESGGAVNATNDGFFVSFGDNTTVKSLKPKLTDRRARAASPAPIAVPSPSPAPTAVASPSPAPTAVALLSPEVTIVSEAPGVSSEIAANLAGQAIVLPATPLKSDKANEEQSPNLGFVIKDEAPATKEIVNEDEMQKKKIKLMEMQRKRKEEQEKKRLEKEAEAAKKQEEKQLKEEEQERKKAEEKARREVIFQQYLQKKQEEEESPVKTLPKKRDGSASKQRPKSMFVKSKAATPEPGSLAPDSGSSSQEDLIVRTNLSGRSTPSAISAMRSGYHFRLPQPGAIRKAVSCNTLRGTANGPSTSRRPPSPDLPGLKLQKQRGSSQDIGSEAGSVSNSGLEYAGPKLFVKPSAKSNRHIIVNAISHCCLAGSVNTDFKNKVLEEMSKCDANHFLILFRDAGCQYRGLFIFYPETEEAFKVHGVGPKHITNEMCEKFYKYNSGAKSFSEITSTKHLSVSVDAVVLHTSVWKSGKAVIKR